MPSISVVNRTLLIYLFTLIVLLAVNADGITFLTNKWLEMEHGTYNHGFLLLAMCVYLFIKNSKLITLDNGSKLQVLALLLTFLLILGAFFLSLISVSSVQVLFVYAASASLFFTLFGWQAMKTMLVPFGLLVFALPFWGAVADLLQWITAIASHAMVYLSGIPALKEGFVIIVPAGRFEVATSCSGVSYFLSAAALAVFYAELNYNSVKSKAIVIVSLVFASIVANWIRVFIVIMAGQMTDMQHPLVTDHFNLGWIIFGVFFVLLLVLFRYKLPDELIADRKLADNGGHFSGEKIKREFAIAGSICIFLVSLVSAKFYLTSVTESNVVVPHVLSESNLSQVATVNLGSRFKGSDESYYKIYNGVDVIQLYHGFYSHQSQGKELISELNYVIDSEKWATKSLKIKYIADKKVNVLDIYSKLSANKYIVWYWYRVGGAVTASEIYAKLFQLPGILKRDRRAEVFVLVSEAGNDQSFEKVFNSLNDQL